MFDRRKAFLLIKGVQILQLIHDGRDQGNPILVPAAFDLQRGRYRLQVAGQLMGFDIHIDADPRDAITNPLIFADGFHKNAAYFFALYEQVVRPFNARIHAACFPDRPADRHRDKQRQLRGE
ncbi:hypothetical protein D1872_243440 [compost metagenome]